MEQTYINAWIYTVILAGTTIVISLCVDWRVRKAAQQNPAEAVRIE